MIKDNLKITRKMIGISQRELGRQIKMSGQYIAKIEKGERTPTIDTLSKIATALNIELNELLERPKFTSEIFFDEIEKKNIIYSEMLTDCNLDTSRLKSALLNNSSYIIDDYYNVGMYLGFSKGFLEKRVNINSEIQKIILSDDYDKYITKISKKYDTWMTNLVQENISIHNGYLGKNLKTLQKNNNISQEKLGDMLGVSGAYIDRLEKGIETKPSIELIYKIATYFDVPLSKLLAFDLLNPYQDFGVVCELGKCLKEQAIKKDKIYNTDKYFKQLSIKPSEWEENNKLKAIGILLKEIGCDLKDFTEDEYTRIEKSLIDYLSTIAYMKK